MKSNTNYLVIIIAGLIVLLVGCGKGFRPSAFQKSQNETCSVSPTAINGHLQYFSYFGNDWTQTKDHINVVWDAHDVDGEIPDIEAHGIKFVLNVWWFGHPDREDLLNGPNWDAFVTKIRPHINNIAAFNVADEPDPGAGNKDYFERQIA